MNRREFLETVAAAAMLPAVARQAPGNEWGSPVFDLHFHLRPQPAANLAHLDGAGVTKANLLTRGAVLEQVKAIQTAAPGRFTWFNSYDVTKPEAEQILTQAVKEGAQGFGEMKFHVAADGPELRRIYALAADLRVPILIHFQEVDHFPNEGTWSTGFAKTFESVLKAYPKTTFIGHADAFWANVSADYHNEAAYPAGPITRGGVTDKLLGDYPNLYRGHVGQFRQQRHVTGSGVHGRLSEAASGQAVLRQRLRLQRRPRRGRQPEQQPGGGTHDREVRGARDVERAEAIHLT